MELIVNIYNELIYYNVIKVTDVIASIILHLWPRSPTVAEAYQQLRDNKQLVFLFNVNYVEN